MLWRQDGGFIVGIENRPIKSCLRIDQPYPKETMREFIKFLDNAIVQSIADDNNYKW